MCMACTKSNNSILAISTNIHFISRGEMLAVSMKAVNREEEDVKKITVEQMFEFTPVPL